MKPLDPDRQFLQWLRENGFHTPDRGDPAPAWVRLEGRDPPPLWGIRALADGLFVRVLVSGASTSGKLPKGPFLIELLDTPGQRPGDATPVADLEDERTVKRSLLALINAHSNPRLQPRGPRPPVTIQMIREQYPQLQRFDKTGDVSELVLMLQNGNYFRITDGRSGGAPEDTESGRVACSFYGAGTSERLGAVEHVPVANLATWIAGKVEEARVRPDTVAQYFTEQFDERYGHPLLNQVPLDSERGSRCVAIIDDAMPLLRRLRASGPDAQSQRVKLADRMRDVLVCFAQMSEIHSRREQTTTAMEY